MEIKYNDLNKFIGKFNAIYSLKKVKSFPTPPIRLKFHDFEKKDLEDPNVLTNDVLTVSFSLHHKTFEWRLAKYGKLYGVITEGFDLNDNDFEDKYFKSEIEAVEYIKNKIEKTYEKFPNL